MRSEVVNGYEVASDGRTIWVNAPTGECVARLSQRAGRDVHRTVEEQQKTGIECLDCDHDPSFEAFAASVLEHYGVRVGEKHRPKSLRPA